MRHLGLRLTVTDWLLTVTYILLTKFIVTGSICIFALAQVNNYYLIHNGWLVVPSVTPDPHPRRHLLRTELAVQHVSTFDSTYIEQLFL